MDGWVGVMAVLWIVMDGWVGGCIGCFEDCYGWMDGWVYWLFWGLLWMDGWVGVMPVLRIVVDGWNSTGAGLSKNLWHSYLLHRE